MRVLITVHPSPTFFASPSHRPIVHHQRHQLMRWLYAMMIAGQPTFKSYHDEPRLKIHAFAWRPIRTNVIECLVSSAEPDMLSAIVQGFETSEFSGWQPLAADPVLSPDPLAPLQPMTGIKLRAAHATTPTLHEDPAFRLLLVQHIAHRLGRLGLAEDAVHLQHWWPETHTLQLQGDHHAAQMLVDSGLGLNTASGLGMLADPETVFLWHSTGRRISQVPS